MSDKQKLTDSGPLRAIEKYAVISNCETYRYSLARRWAGGALLPFVMLNPSTADADIDDPTIRRCMGFARREGYAGIHVVNLYAYRATDPKALLTCVDAVGPQNDTKLLRMLTGVSCVERPVVAAWGANAKPERVAQVMALVPDVNWRCLGTTKDGHPRHPLYVKGDQPLVPFGTSVRAGQDSL
jgi:hypothetical protein